MSSLILSTKSVYSRSLLLLLISLDILAASLSGYIIDIKLDSTFYISLLLWGAISYFTGNYNGKTYTQFQSLTYHHLISIFGHAVACLLIGITCHAFISFNPAVTLGIPLFWLIGLTFKSFLFSAYYFLRNSIIHDKQYLIIGYSPQGYALRKFLKRQHGYLYRYTGTKKEPLDEADLHDIASYCIDNNINTIYYAGSEDNTFIPKLYLLANQHYIYFHYVLPYNENTSYKWEWSEEYGALAMLTCSPSRSPKRKHKPTDKTNFIYHSV